MAADAFGREEIHAAVGSRIASRYRLLHTLGSGGTQDFSSTADKGSWTMLVRVRGWNGEKDDDRIEVAVFPSSGLPKESFPAKWDGTDAWPIPRTAIADGYSDVEHPRFVDGNGYVAGGVLVASLPESEMLIAGKNTIVPVHLTAGFVTGRLEKKGAAWAIRDGVVAARWKVSDLFTTLSVVTLAGQSLCRDSGYYAVVKKTICALPDITSELASPTADCDAVSVGMLYQAEPAKLGACLLDPPGRDELGTAVRRPHRRRQAEPRHQHGDQRDTAETAGEECVEALDAGEGRDPHHRHRHQQRQREEANMADGDQHDVRRHRQGHGGEE